MNTHEAWKGIVMEQEEAECAAFVIDTVTVPFLFSGIAKPGEQYTLSFWTSSEGDGSITVGGETFPTGPQWTKQNVTFAAEGEDVPLWFDAAGTYYIFQPQLEVGNLPSDYVPAPEDSTDEWNRELGIVKESISQISLDAEGIETRVSKTEKQISGVTGELVTINESVSSLKQTASEFVASIQTLNENGTGKVSNTTGTFDKKGLTIDNSESPTKTTITPDGMKVYRKKGTAKEAVLTANSEGVDAVNLHASTYLTIGGRSRMENYGSNRTGLFWIGDVT